MFAVRAVTLVSDRNEHASHIFRDFFEFHAICNVAFIRYVYLVYAAGIVSANFSTDVIRDYSTDRHIPHNGGSLRNTRNRRSPSSPFAFFTINGFSFYNCIHDAMTFERISIICAICILQTIWVILIVTSIRSCPILYMTFRVCSAEGFWTFAHPRFCVVCSPHFPRFPRSKRFYRFTRWTRSSRFIQSRIPTRSTYSMCYQSLSQSPMLPVVHALLALLLLLALPALSATSALFLLFTHLVKLLQNFHAFTLARNQHVFFFVDFTPLVRNVCYSASFRNESVFLVEGAWIWHGILQIKISILKHFYKN